MVHFDMRNRGNGMKIHAAAEAHKSRKAWPDAHAAPAAH
jgi:hypothetical protein